jgi:hypothetical protein
MLHGCPFADVVSCDSCNHWSWKQKQPSSI